MRKQAEFEQRIERIEDLVAQLESQSNPAVRKTAHELVQSVMDLHEAGLDQMLEILYEAGQAGQEIIDRFGREDPARCLLLLYGLHPVSIQDRVLQALDKSRPYLKSHKGDVELLGVDESGTVHLRLQGSCDGCPSSALTLKMAIEEAIREAAPDVTTITVENALVSLDHGDGQSNGEADSVDWTEIDSLHTLPSGAARSLDLHTHPILLCRLDDTYYAYRSTCPACQRRIEVDQLDGVAVQCAGCGQRYDVVKAGRGMDRPSIHLDPFPLLVEGGRARVAIPLYSAHEAAT